MSTVNETSVAPGGAAAPEPAPQGAGEALVCTSCGEGNAPGSRFCRSCGASLSIASVSAPGVAPEEAPQVLAGASSASVAQHEDAKKARQLLDKAFTLFERGDTANAILSCRQSIALAPHAPQGFSMLGLLLERSGDLEEAAAAYARVLSLSPGSRQEAESLERIRATISQRQGQSPAFRFNERERDAALAGSAAVAAPPQPAVARDVADAVSHLAPSPDDHPNMAQLGAGSYGSPSVSSLHFDEVDAEAEPWWKKLAQKPTAFSRGLPLASVAGLSLLLLIWARGSALSRYPQDAQMPAGVDATPLSTVDTPPPVADPAQAAQPSSVASGDLAQVSPPSAAYPVTNRPQALATAAPAAQANPAPAPQAEAPRASRPAPSRPQPEFPPETSVVPPVSPSSLPPALPSPAQPLVSSQPSRPQGGTLFSSGGGPLGPVSSSRNQGVTLSRPRTPTEASERPSSRRTTAEDAAARALRAGRPDVAIRTLDRTIRNGGEAAWTYQQRALAFIERGDYQRAADDFQTAISAYRDQIARGERVEEARAGVAASQSGLNLALQNLRQ